MRSFDIQALNSNVIQYWSSLSFTDNVITGQKTGTGVSDMVFTAATDPAIQNRTISRSTTSSIQLNYVASVTTPELQDFSVTMIIQPETSDLWILKFDQSGNDIGVRINENTTIELIWNTVTDDDFDPQIVLESRTLIYDEDVAYLSLSRKDNLVVLTYNNEQISIIGAPLPVQDIIMGEGTGSALVDRIALSDQGIGLRAADYGQLFVQNRLDTVPRPDGASAFNYLLDAYRPDVYVLDQDSFLTDLDYKYAKVETGYAVGYWQIIKRASFDIELSVDLGETWYPLPYDMMMDYQQVVIFRHQNSSDEDFWIEARFTYAADVPMSHFDVTITGKTFLPADVGTGYYDADAGYFEEADFNLIPLEPDVKIRTLEVFGGLENPAAFLPDLTEADYTLYVNGVVSDLDNIKQDQLYHIVAVFNVAQDFVDFHVHQLVGLGASEIAYDAWEVEAIFKTFIGTPLITCYEEIEKLVDGVSDSGGASSVLDLQWQN